MKWYQYFIIFFVILLGILMYFIIKHGNFNRKIHSQMIFELKDTNFASMFPDKFANLKQISLFRYIHSGDTLVKLEITYVGNVYDYVIDLLLEPVYPIISYYYFNQNDLESFNCKVVYQSSYSVFYHKPILLPKPTQFNLLLARCDTFFHVYGFFSVEDSVLNVNATFLKDSIRIYNYELL